VFFTDSTLSRRRAGLHTDAVSLATSVTRDGPGREERRRDDGNADEDGGDCWADLPTPISTAARTASAASGSIRREVPHDLVVRCDNDGYRGVVRGDEKCARQDWIEAAPNLTNEEQGRRRDLGLGGAPDDSQFGQRSDATIENDDRPGRKNMLRASGKILTPPELVVRFFGCEIGPRRDWQSDRESAHRLSPSRGRRHQTAVPAGDDRPTSVGQTPAEVERPIPSWIALVDLR